ncbi:MAG: hypothetical protein MI867_03425 [Pseudomonadales bacterium]|nr:hypothetical protein [Pseudomonadales bacterium]
MSENPQGTGPSDAEILAAVPPRASGREARLGLFVILGLISFVIVLYQMKIWMQTKSKTKKAAF